MDRRRQQRDILLWAAGIAGIFLTAAARADVPPDVSYQSGSTTPLIQLSGERFQIYTNGQYASLPTENLTLTQYGIAGLDEGPMVEISGTVYFLWGDTFGTYPGSGGLAGKNIFYDTDRGRDPMGYIPDVTLRNCSYISQVEQQVASGNTAPVVSFSGCPRMDYFINPSHTATQPIFQPNTVNNLTATQDLAAARTPTGAFALNNFLYEFYNVAIKNCGTGAVHRTNSILAKTTTAESAWSQNNPPTFTELYDASVIDIPDCANLPAEATSSGKFMFVAAAVVPKSILASKGLLAQLPPALQTANQVIFLWGSSWHYRSSNLYLAAVSDDPSSGIDSGVAAWWYYKGNSQWSADETAAAPLLTTFDGAGAPSMGEHSVLWIAGLNRFVLLYGQNATGGLVYRTAQAPWGPWTTETTFLPRTGGWADMLLSKGASPISPDDPQIYDSSGAAFPLPSTGEGFYGPRLLQTHDVNSDGSVTLYFDMSTFVPYQAFLAKTTLIPAADATHPQSEAPPPVQVYPNPWRAGRGQPVVTFSNLAPDSTVKIFTIVGTFVRSVTASGSHATWDLNNTAGSSAASGVYVYIATDSQGQQKKGKFAIAR